MFWHIISYSDARLRVLRTWGLERLGLQDLEICLAGICISKAEEIFGGLADNMMIHQEFRSGTCITEPFSTPIYVMETTSIVLPGTTVLRVIVPDVTGKWPWESGCFPVYRQQLNPAERYEMLQLLSAEQKVHQDG